MRPSFPRNLPRRGEHTIARDTGELQEIVRVIFDESGEERGIARIEVIAEIIADAGVMKGIHDVGGGGEGANLMGSYVGRQPAPAS